MEATAVHDLTRTVATNLCAHLYAKHEICEYILDLGRARHSRAPAAAAAAVKGVEEKWKVVVVVVSCFGSTMQHSLPIGKELIPLSLLMRAVRRDAERSS